jgi:hypothetical protein
MAHNVMGNFAHQLGARSCVSREPSLQVMLFLAHSLWGAVPAYTGEELLFGCLLPRQFRLSSGDDKDSLLQTVSSSVQFSSKGRLKS